MKGPNAWAVIWESGVSPILARTLNLPFPAPLRTPHLLKAVRGYPEKVKSQVISVAHTHLRYFFSTPNKLHQNCAKEGSFETSYLLSPLRLTTELRKRPFYTTLKGVHDEILNWAKIRCFLEF